MAKFIEIKEVLAKFERDFEFDSIGYDMDIIQWFVEGLQEIGTNETMLPTCVECEIIGGKVKLPCNAELLLSVKFNDTPLSHIDALKNNHVNSAWYSITGNYINISSLKGKVKLLYLAFAQDCENELMIPDVIELKEALIWRAAMKLCLRGVSHVTFDYKLAKAHWDDLKGKASNALLFPSPDEIPAMMVYYDSIVPNFNPHYE